MKGRDMSPEFFEWSLRHLGLFAFLMTLELGFIMFASLTSMLHLNDSRKHLEKAKDEKGGVDPAGVARCPPVKKSTPEGVGEMRGYRGQDTADTH
jgi:hypothetical protein